jgi:hypothetical protein
MYHCGDGSDLGIDDRFWIPDFYPDSTWFSLSDMILLCILPTAFELLSLFPFCTISSFFVHLLLL